MAAPKGDKRIGNEFWKLRSKHGRDKLFKTPNLLWIAATEYFQWCEDNPLYEVKAFNTRENGIVQEQLPKIRALTLTGLCLYLDCSTEYFRHFETNNKDSKDFMPIITRIRETIYTQKFEGAAADLLNPNIIARDLGLVDKKELEIEQKMTPEERQKEIAELKEKLLKE